MAQDKITLLPFDAVIEKAFFSSNRIDLLRNYAALESTDESPQTNPCTTSVNGIAMITFPPISDNRLKSTNGKSISKSLWTPQSTTLKPHVQVRAGPTKSTSITKQSNSRTQVSNKDGRSFGSDTH